MRWAAVAISRSVRAADGRAQDHRAGGGEEHLKPAFFLDEPQYHHLSTASRRFRGAALALDGPVVETLRILEGGRVVGETPVDKPCPELAFLPFPRAAECRFDATIEGGDEVRVVYADGREEAVFRLSGRPRHRIETCIERLPRPTGELVALTQGGGDVRSYEDSMISGLHTLDTLLRASGIESDELKSILDIGCGTGRLLMGWHCADKSRRIAGVDINAQLIGWARANLPGEWSVCDVLPPLEQQGFDLVQLVSVFTHLPLEHQRRWVEEIRRVLHPRGLVVITLHGEIYKRIFGQSGEYSELPTGAIGSNSFATFHTRAFAEELFGGFELLGYFERGHDAEPATTFHIGSLQDVYVFRKV